jgi:hypothetical protein
MGTLDTGLVRSIEIAGSRGRRATLLLGGPGDAYWILQWDTPSGKTLKWPASSTSVRAALRLLGALRTSPEAGPGPVAQPLTRIVLGTAGGRRAQLLMSETPLGGRTAVSAEDLTGIALGEEALAQVFGADLGLWRDHAVFPIDTADASRVEFVGGPAGISLSRVGKSWAVVKPVSLPGDEPIIAATLKALGSIACVRFADDPDPEGSSSSFLSPTARVVIEIDRRVPRGDQTARTTLFQELVVGGPADVAGQTLLGRLSAWSVELETGAKSELWGPIVGVIPRDAIAAVSTDPAAYASRVATRVPAADVARLSIGADGADGFKESLAFTRGADGWRSDRASSITPEARAACESLLRLLTAERAHGSTSTPPDGYTPEWSAQLAASDGKLLDQVETGTYAAGASRALCVHAGHGYLRYPGFAGTAPVLWFSQQGTPK